MMLSGYMNFCFTGEMKDSTANIVGHVPYDNKNSRWQTPKDLTYCVFPIPREKLCELCLPGETIGHITDEFKPDMEVHKTYDKIFNDIFAKIFDKLKPLYNVSKEMEEKHGTSI